MSDGGKGSARRPAGVTDKQLQTSWDAVFGGKTDYAKFPDKITVIKTHYQVKSGTSCSTYIEYNKVTAKAMQEDHIRKSRELSNNYLDGNEEVKEFTAGAVLKLKPSNQTFVTYEGETSNMEVDISTLYKYKKDGLIDFDPPMKS